MKGVIYRFTWALAILLAWSGCFAQAVTPTPEQLRILQQLPADQRQAILRSLGVTPATGQAPVAPQEAELPPDQRPPEKPEDLTEPAIEEEPRITGRDTIIVDLKIIENIEPDNLLALTNDPRLVRVLGSHSYELDKRGVLLLPGIASIPLAGLSAEEAAKRIDAEPELRFFDSTVTILPLEPTGTAALEPFGYDLFAEVPTTFAPATDIAVPTDYVMGPGDVVRVQLFGKQNQFYDLMISRDGTLNFPEIGPIAVAGMRFDDLRQELQRRLAEQMIGVRASVTLAELRSIRVFVLGDAERPGSYSVSSLSTMTNALFASGGVKPIGSLRNIQLKRNGKIVTRLDLYDLLIRGDTRGDERLQPGDVLFIPPVGPTVGIAGEVKRPAIYEFKQERTVADLVELAGGLLPSADTREAQLERITEDRTRSVLTLNLDAAAGRATTLRSGDVLSVRTILDEYSNAVSLSGHVHRPGKSQWFPGMRLSDLIPSIQELRPNADLNYVLVRRELPPDRRLVALSGNLGKALQRPGSEADIELTARDEVFVFDLKAGRSGIVEPILEDIRLQSSHANPSDEVAVGGRVKAPGNYPREIGMRISDLIRAGGGLDEAAYALAAELTRYEVTNGEFRKTELVDIDLASVLAGNSAANIALQPHDYLNIKEIPEWSEQEQVEIIGEVRFPGKYPIKRGETLGHVLQRAGGLTDLAFPEGTIFLRAELREREQEQKEVLAQRLESDLAALSLQDAESREALSVGQTLLTQLRTTPATGRLVIDLEQIIRHAGTSKDIVLKDKDQLMIPRSTQEVTVLGEVQYSTSHIYEPTLRRDEYINRSGGLTQRADAKRIYVVRASGSVVTKGRSRWFGRSSDEGVRPGDTIVVPLDADRMRPLTFWTNVTQILYNLAIAAAAVNSF